ncbi:hypothetical protein Tco_1310795 [Tanacetum coccineum]
MEALQAFLKEYDHIPPNEKCMALLLAEERFLKIKQAMEEEHNQPEVLQKLLLKLINDLQILKEIQQEKKKPTAQIGYSLPDESSSDHTKETRSGSTTTHANYSLPEASRPDAPMIDNFNELNDDQRGSEIDFSQNVEDDDSFTFVIRIFLLFLTYLEVSPLSCSTGSEDTNFDPGKGIPLRAGAILIGMTFIDYPDFEDSRAHGFVHLFELHILSFI